MKTGTFIVEGGIGDINEKIFSELKEIAFVANTMEADAMEESGGVPLGIRVKNNRITLNKGTNLLHARVVYDYELRNSYKLLFSHSSVIPAQAGIQIKPMRVWIPFFKGMTEMEFRNSQL